MDWSPQHAAAIEQVADWHRTYAQTGKQVFRVFGYAGTGKTTLAREFASKISGATCFAAFTGKAALMMRRNGCEGASTIHGLIYDVKERSDGAVEFVLNPESPAAQAALIVIDECSMVDEDLGRDLMSFGKPILVLGDPAQLPPARSAGFFTDAKPDVMLTEIHRQAEGNPIIQMATLVRTGGTLKLGQYGESRVVERGVLTTHKAQGSQWADVIVYDESGVFREDWRRWLYTAITRASDRITVVTSGEGA